jgi:hypothetical protein
MMLEAAKCETSFYHQPEAQHPKPSAVHNARLVPQCGKKENSPAFLRIERPSRSA